jgi:hypothetical protein
MRSYNFNLDITNGRQHSHLSGHLFITYLLGERYLGRVGSGFTYRLFRITRTRLSDDEYGLEFMLCGAGSPYYLYLRYPRKIGYPTNVEWPDYHDLNGFEYELKWMIQKYRIRKGKWFTKYYAVDIKREAMALFTKWFGDSLDMDTPMIG